MTWKTAQETSENYNVWEKNTEWVSSGRLAIANKKISEHEDIETNYPKANTSKKKLISK